LTRILSPKRKQNNRPQTTRAIQHQSVFAVQRSRNALQRRQQTSQNSGDMMTHAKRARWSAWAGVCALCISVAVPAVAQQNYPARAVRFIVPFPAGGFSDVLARVLTQKLSESSGQPVIVENRPGASGNIGADFVAKAPPDGYTLLVTSSNFTTNPSQFKKLPFDPVRDFAHVMLVSQGALVATVHPSMPVRSVRELIAFARGRPGELNYASSGVGTTGHYAGELLNVLMNVRMVHVPYKGSGGAMNAIIGGEVAIAFPQMPPALPHIATGRLRALAVTTQRRSATLPDLPTMAEAGVPGFEISGWLGIAAPAATPREVVNLLHRELTRALRDPAVGDIFVKQGADPVALGSEQTSGFIAADIAKWSKVARQAKMTAQ
jgi:tripartite-type tricarboxylate transporter receptor subunit TctC